MSRVDDLRRCLAIAPWVVAGALFLGWDGSVAAQDAATPTPMTVEETTEQTAAPAAETPAAAGGAQPAQVPRTGVGIDATSGGGPLAWGALAGAAIAAAAALRERFRAR